MGTKKENGLHYKVSVGSCFLAVGGEHRSQRFFRGGFIFDGVVCGRAGRSAKPIVMQNLLYQVFFFLSHVRG